MKTRVLVCHEKHGNRYFLIKDDWELFAASKKILKERLAEGWYSNFSKPESLGMTINQIKKLPKGQIRRNALVANDDYVKMMGEYQTEIDFKERVKLALESSFDSKKPNNNMPFKCLYWRSSRHYEYETLELITPERV